MQFSLIKPHTRECLLVSPNLENISHWPMLLINTKLLHPLQECSLEPFTRTEPSNYLKNIVNKLSTPPPLLSLRRLPPQKKMARKKKEKRKIDEDKCHLIYNIHIFLSKINNSPMALAAILFFPKKIKPHFSTQMYGTFSTNILRNS